MNIEARPGQARLGGRMRHVCPGTPVRYEQTVREPASNGGHIRGVYTNVNAMRGFIIRNVVGPASNSSKT